MILFFPYQNQFSLTGFSFFFQAEDGIRDCLLSRGLGDVYKRQLKKRENVGNANIPFYRGHRWILRASQLVYWFFQYNNLQHRANKKVFLK